MADRSLDEIIRWKSRRTNAGRGNQSQPVKQRLSRNFKKPFFSSRFEPSKNGNQPKVSRSLLSRLGQPFKRHQLPQNSRLNTTNKVQNTFIQNKLLIQKALVDTQQSTFQRHRSNAPPERTNKSWQKKPNSRRDLWTKDDNINPLRVRISNGTIVRGLHSDQLLLQKGRESQTTKKRFPREREKPRSEHFPITWKNDFLSSQKVSMSINQGLTVSIDNEEARLHEYNALRRQQRVSYDSTESSGSDVYEVEDPELPQQYYYVHPAQSQSKHSSDHRNVEPEIKTDERNPQIASLLKIAAKKPPLPTPHRQTLDSKVQREIATLQGKEYSIQIGRQKTGPGPGLKGFRMIPLVTKQSLHERFTQDKDTAAL